MAKAILVDSGTNPRIPEIRRSFRIRQSHLAVADSTIGDQVMFYRTTRQSDPGYFARADVIDVSQEPESQHYFQMQLANYRPLRSIVPHSETGVRAGSASDARQWVNAATVQPISDENFEAIIKTARGVRPLTAANQLDILTGIEEVELPSHEQRELILNRRSERNPAFTRRIRKLYDFRCALSGERFISLDGRHSEAEVCHIWPVGHEGPDVVQNALVISKAIHWIFDNHLITISGDYRILGAESLSAKLQAFLNADRRLILPKYHAHRPSGFYLAYHRAEFLKKGGLL